MCARIQPQGRAQLSGSQWGESCINHSKSLNGRTVSLIIYREAASPVHSASLCAFRRSKKAPKGHLRRRSFRCCSCGKLSYWPCPTVLNRPQKPRAPPWVIYTFSSPFEGYLLIWCVTSCLKSFMKKEAITHMRWEVVFCRRLSLCLCPLALSLCRLTMKEGCEGRRVMTRRGF